MIQYDVTHEGFFMDAMAQAVFGEGTRYTLVAHSRATTGATLACASFRDRIEALVYLDCPMGSGLIDDWLPSETYRCYLEDSRLVRKKLRGPVSYDSLDAYATLLERDLIFPKTKTTALAIARRQCRAAGGSEDWTGPVTVRDDPRSFVECFPLGVTRDWYNRTLSRVQAPVLYMIAKNGMGSLEILHDDNFESKIPDEIREKWHRYKEEWVTNGANELALMPAKVTTVHVDGYHHVHSDQPDKISALVLNWLQESSSKL